MYSKMRMLYISERYPSPPGFTEKLHKLDNERDKYMNNAENKCRKRRMGEPTYLQKSWYGKIGWIYGIQ